MVMPVTLRRFTVDEVDAFPPDGNRYELLDGVLLVTPAPGLPHQTVALRLATDLERFLGGGPDVGVWSPGVVTIDRESRLMPDVMVGVVPGSWTDWSEIRDRWLVVEVSGPGSRVYDQEYKRDAYLATGARAVWIIDLTTRAISVTTSRGGEPAVEGGPVVWRHPRSRRELIVNPDRLFRGIPPVQRVR